MMFRIQRLREKGRPKSKAQLKAETPLRLDVSIRVSSETPLGRSSRVASIHHGGPAGTDPIPKLYDAEVNSMAPLAMIITGVEEIDGVLYSQSWWCKID